MGRFRVEIKKKPAEAGWVLGGVMSLSISINRFTYGTAWSWARRAALVVERVA